MSWENDDRGKPCKWRFALTISPDDALNPRYMFEVGKSFGEARMQCQSDVAEIMRTGEYVVIVPPETISEQSMETGVTTFTVRARVRWVTPEARANRERALKAMAEAIDDEAAKCQLPVDRLPGD